MVEPAPIATLVERLRSGDATAAEDLFVRYATRLTRLAEQHLSRKLASRLEGEDIVQSVFRTFYRRMAAGAFQLDSTAQIWRLLVKITLLKTRAKGRYHTAGMRNAAAEQAGDAWLAEAAAHEPGPDEAVMLVDQVESLLRGLPALHGQVLEQRLQGNSVTDIATQLEVSRMTVHRILNLLQQRLNDQL